MSTNKNVAIPNSAGQLATINQRAFAGKGTEEIGQDDVNTPILKILHQLSPECNSRNAKFVKDAKPGMIYSNSFGCLVEGSQGLPVIVAHSQTRWPEWQQKGETISAPVGVHMSPPANATEEMRGIRYRLSNGNYVEKTMYFYVIALVNNEPRPAVITMRSSNLTPARELNNMLKNLRMTDDKGTFQPASFSAIFNLKTAEKSAGDKNWHVYKPTLTRMLDVNNADDAKMFEMGSEFQKKVSVGFAKPKYDKTEKAKEEII
tara:strand:+ start:147 stop:929 length:783 start_codon:yes stop_codon:yes gene_type:complete